MLHEMKYILLLMLVRRNRRANGNNLAQNLMFLHLSYEIPALSDFYF